MALWSKSCPGVKPEPSGKMEPEATAYPGCGESYESSECGGMGGCDPLTLRRKVADAAGPGSSMPLLAPRAWPLVRAGPKRRESSPLKLPALLLGIMPKVPMAPSAA